MVRINDNEIKYIRGKMNIVLFWISAMNVKDQILQMNGKNVLINMTTKMSERVAETRTVQLTTFETLNSVWEKIGHIRKR